MKSVLLSLVAAVVLVMPVSAFAKGGAPQEPSASVEGLNLIEADMYITEKGQPKTKFKTADEVFAAHGGTAEQIDLKSLPENSAVINVDSVAELDALLTYS